MKESPLQKARRLSGGTHKSLADAAGVKTRMATYWLSGEHPISVEGATALSKAVNYQVTPQELLPTFDWETVKRGFEKRRK